MNEKLHKLGIDKLNALQEKSIEAARNRRADLIVYAPTGSGKTLAVALPLLERVRPEAMAQAVVLVPSRELATQWYEVLRAITDAAIKVTSVYGGSSVEDERLSLAATPAIVVATPGRLLDHLKRGHITLDTATTLIIDEFDKALELGFEGEMRQIVKRMPAIERRFFTSATRLKAFPDFITPNNPEVVDFLKTERTRRVRIWEVASPEKDKLDTLRRLLLSMPDAGRVLVFVNYRDAAVRVHDFLVKQHISAGLYHGALEQLDREKALALFANGTTPVVVATDLGARGLDIDNVTAVVHYHLPVNAEAWTHRNGRTARVDRDGDVYVIFAPGDDCPDFITTDAQFFLPATTPRASLKAAVATLHINAGKKEKISRGDILGFIAANSQGLVQATDIGRINVAPHYSLVAVPAATAHALAAILSAARLKSRRVRVTLATI